jgi:lambda repressor-like predicted transcriptional regulator
MQYLCLWDKKRKKELDKILYPGDNNKLGWFFAKEATMELNKKEGLKDLKDLREKKEEAWLRFVEACREYTRAVVGEEAPPPFMIRAALELVGVKPIWIARQLGVKVWRVYTAIENQRHRSERKWIKTQKAIANCIGGKVEDIFPDERRQSELSTRRGFVNSKDSAKICQDGAEDEIERARRLV